MKRAMVWLLAAGMILLAGCGGAPAKNADLNAVKDAIAQKYDMSEMMELSTDDLLDVYGINAEDIKQYVALVAKTGTSADEILLFEGTDADAAARIREKVEARYQAKLNEAKDYLPDEYTKTAACKVETSGNYVSMIVSADAEDMTRIYQDAIK